MNRNYGFFILDNMGRQVRRYRVSRRTIRWAVGLLGLVVVGIGALAVHGVVQISSARQAERLVHENRALRRMLADIEDRLPAAEQHAALAGIAFSQLWAKSGLGVEERLLGVGPVERGGDAVTPAQEPLRRSAERIEKLPPEALTKEFSRLDAQSIRLQRLLAQTQEYFNDAHRLLSNTPSVRPAPAASWLSSSFGKRRDPISGRWVMHKGLDMAGQVGMAIHAPADGVVIWTGRRGGYGKTVVIDHGFGLQTHYAHLSRFLVRPGQRVSRGDDIAEMGSTGKSTGPHLHYEVRRRGQPLDPSNFILD